MSEDRRESPANRAEREAFVCASYAELFRWFVRLTGCRDRAADLTQDTFVAFWESLDRRRQQVSTRTWLYAIGRNLWRKHVRDRKAWEMADPNAVADRRSAPDRDEQDREFRAAVAHALAELPEPQREAFTLRFWHGFDFEQIGEIQGVLAGVARWRYFAARRRLHERLAAWAPEGRPERREEETNHARRDGPERGAAHPR